MAAVVEPGDKIAADVITDNNGKDWLDNIRITDTSGRKLQRPAGSSLPIGSAHRSRTDQSRSACRFGKALLVTSFIRAA